MGSGTLFYSIIVSLFLYINLTFSVFSLVSVTLLCFVTCVLCSVSLLAVAYLSRVSTVIVARGRVSLNGLILLKF